MCIRDRVTINYVITDVERKRKFVCVDPHDMPIIAIVDPDMMSSMPKGLTASICFLTNGSINRIFTYSGSTRLVSNRCV